MNNRITKIVWLILVTFLFGACYSDKYSQSVLKERDRLNAIRGNLKVGMTMAEVRAIAGEPNTSEASPGGWEEFRYGTDVVNSDRGKRVVRGFIVQFSNGKVFAVDEIVVFVE